MPETPERSESGSPIYRHEERDRPIEPPVPMDERARARMGSHLKRFVGPPDRVFHELVSDLVHIDVHLMEPGPGYDHYTLVTSGMSDRPMSAPESDEGRRYAELVICLPPSWPLTDEALKDERNYWPVRWLKKLARLPHEYDTWLFAEHTVPNGDPPAPFADNTELCCAFLAAPVLFGEDFMTLEVSEGKIIHFLSLVPLYREEMDFKLRNGSERLAERLGEAGVSELLDVGRKNVCKKRWGLF